MIHRFILCSLLLAEGYKTDRLSKKNSSSVPPHVVMLWHSDNTRYDLTQCTKFWYVCVFFTVCFNWNISRVENEKGLCAYILYMRIAPFHSQPTICDSVTVLLSMKELC